MEKIEKLIPSTSKKEANVTELGITAKGSLLRSLCTWSNLCTLGEELQTEVHQELSFSLSKNIFYKQMHSSLYILLNLDPVCFLIINPAFLWLLIMSYVNCLDNLSQAERLQQVG